MTDVEADRWRILLSRDHFLSALKALKLGRRTVSNRKTQLYVALFKGEAAFCLNGTETRCAATGYWPGCAVTSVSWVLPFLKIPPIHDPVEITRIGDRIRFEGVAFPAKWVDVPSWLSPVLVEAHFNTIEPDRPDRHTILLYCPECGKKEGTWINPVQPTSGTYPLQFEGLVLGGAQRARANDVPATRRCKACGHEWIEIEDE